MRTKSARYAVVQTTCADQATAAKIAQALLKQKLAACVQSLPIQSTYSWKGAINHDAEILLFIKAPAANFAAVETAIRASHSYEVPEIVQLPITAASAGYLKWIDEVTVTPKRPVPAKRQRVSKAR